MGGEGVVVGGLGRGGWLGLVLGVFRVDRQVKDGD